MQIVAKKLTQGRNLDTIKFELVVYIIMAKQGIDDIINDKRIPLLSNSQPIPPPRPITQGIILTDANSLFGIQFNCLLSVGL